MYAESQYYYSNLHMYAWQMLNVSDLALLLHWFRLRLTQFPDYSIGYVSVKVF